MLSPTRTFALGTLILAALALTACVKQVEPKPDATPAPEPEPFAGVPASLSQPGSAGGVHAAAIAAAERAAAKVEVASTNTVNNGVLYKQAQSFFAEKKYPEALRALDDIQAELMTSPQTKAVEDLRTQITAAQAGKP